MLKMDLNELLNFMKIINLIKNRKIIIILLKIFFNKKLHHFLNLFSNSTTKQIKNPEIGKTILFNVKGNNHSSS